MSLFKKSIGFLAVLTAIPASFALTARPSVIGTASSRMPTMTALITNSGGGTTIVGGATTTTSTLLANAECIDAYTSCIKGADACGPDLEECTTKVLFHGKMPACMSTLAQCSTAGVQSLFGTGTVTALSAAAPKNSYGEVTDYIYPTDGSVLGQLIIGAAISNKYDTSTCVKRYTSCLNKDSVCGNDFELCTTNREFNKQKILCDSTLARCQSDGKIALFGTANTDADPAETSRIGEMIKEGAELASFNAVNTCYRVAEQCILNACAENPFQCYENSTQYMVDLVKKMSDENNTAAISSLTDTLQAWGKRNVSNYIKNACFDTIASNKYCHITVTEKIPSTSDLKNEEERQEVFESIYESQMNAAMDAKISELVTEFDTKAKNKCSNTIKSCVMRTCGSGSGAACYSEVFGKSGNHTINQTTDGLYEELQTGCSAVVNSDPNCIYAALNPNSAGTYAYQYNKGDAFTTLFPEYEEGGNDPIGVVSALNATLQNSYSDAAIATMKRQCQAVATSCVKSMCGADYQNCYRNRTDVYSSLTNTGDTRFDNSMNKVGGVLDYTIVLGLCLDTVKNASVCEEHLAIERNKLKIANNSSASSWGGANSTREGWIDAGAATKFDDKYSIHAKDENGKELCTTKGGSDQAICNTSDAEGNIYDQPVIIGYDTYVQTQAASTLFKDLIYDLEKEAQAKYNAKLTKQQNMCMSSNTGGIMGKNEMGSTFLWVKLKSNKVPKSYAVSGLKPSQFAASNDIYGSFCRVRVTLHSDDKKIQDVIAKGPDWAVTYFAAGDAFTCGSWIPEKALNDLAEAVAQDARDDEAKGDGRTKAWMAVLGTVAGGGLGAWGGNKIADSNFLGGLNGGTVKSSQEYAQQCVNNGDKFLADKSNTAYLTKMLSAARKINTSKKIDGADKDDLETAIRDLTAAMSNSDIMSKSGADYSDKIKCKALVIKKGQGDLNRPQADWVLIDRFLTTCEYKAEKNGTTEDPKCTTTNNIAAATDGTVIYCEETPPAGLEPKASDYNNTADFSVTKTGNAADDTEIKDIAQAVVTLQTRCGQWDDDSAAQKAKSIGTAIGAGVGAVAGGVLAYQATRSIQDAQLDKVEQAAYDAWMSEVGNHIRCFVGGDEVGMYGDIISTSME